MSRNCDVWNEMLLEEALHTWKCHREANSLMAVVIRWQLWKVRTIVKLQRIFIRKDSFKYAQQTHCKSWSHIALFNQHWKHNAFLIDKLNRVGVLGSICKTLSSRVLLPHKHSRPLSATLVPPSWRSQSSSGPYTAVFCPSDWSGCCRGSTVSSSVPAWCCQIAHIHMMCCWGLCTPP